MVADGKYGEMEIREWPTPVLVIPYDLLTLRCCEDYDDDDHVVRSATKSQDISQSFCCCRYSFLLLWSQALAQLPLAKLALVREWCLVFDVIEAAERWWCGVRGCNGGMVVQLVRPSVGRSFEEDRTRQDSS